MFQFERPSTQQSSDPIFSSINEELQVPDGGKALLIIDPQVDFHPGGSLAIPSANDDAERIRNFITDNLESISQIHITLDSHQRYHIAHSIFWTNANGESPPPFTIISEADIHTGRWVPTNAKLKDFAIFYARTLEANSRFQLCIWPEHCIVGTPGHAIVPRINDAILNWSAHHSRPVNYVLKGGNSYTEHYSALRADVEIPLDPSTCLNTGLIDSLKRSESVYVCGQAMSHCVNFTIRDLVKHFSAEMLSSIYVLRNCMSSVPGFEEAGLNFIDDMRSLGVTIDQYDETFMKKQEIQ